MTCQQARDLFSARVDDALSPAEQAELLAHLATCADCQREWARFEQTVALLQAIEPAHAPAGFVDRVVAARPRPWHTRLARGLFVPWPVKLPLEAAAVLLVAGLAIVIVQRSPELQHASRLDELRSPTPAPTTLAREAPAESTTALTGPAPTAPTPSSEGRFGVPLPDATSSTRSEFGSEPRQDTRDAEGLARVRERAPTATERELTQNVPGTRAKKADAPPAEPRKEGSKVGGLAPTPAPPALTSTSAAPPATPSAPTASPPATAPSVSGATESMAKQVTPERRAAAQGLTQVAPGLQARLAVVDRAAAEVTVRDLVARATGLVLSQSAASQADAASTTYVLLVPADRWDELRRGLEGLGTLRVTGQKAEDAGQLLITLRLER